MPRTYGWRLLGWGSLLASASIYVFFFRYWWAAAVMFVVAGYGLRRESVTREAEGVVPVVLPVGAEWRRLIGGTLCLVFIVVGLETVFTRAIGATCFLILPFCWAPEEAGFDGASPANRFLYRVFSSAAYSVIAVVVLIIAAIVLFPWIAIFKHFLFGGS